MKTEKFKTWRDLIQGVIERLPREFSLTQVLSFKNEVAAEYPENRFIDAKIRQTLQVLRDQGVLKFLGGGRYRRLDTVPTISLLLDQQLAAGYASKTQIARVTVETWAELNLYCLSCASDRLQRLSANTPLADFACPMCSKQYQLKAKDGRFAGQIQGAAYRPLLEAANNRGLPDYILAEYDTRFSQVCWVRAVPGSRIDSSRIVARAALASTARRAGWIGAIINLAGLPSVNIIAPKAEERTSARLLWRGIKE